MVSIKRFGMNRIKTWNNFYIYLTVISGVILIFTSNPLNSWAKVTGVCSNCHTMHNSQNGIDVDPNGPNQNLLLVSDCIGCHSATDGTTWQGIGGAPIVYNTSPPQYGARYGSGPYQGLAGGNFYWVSTGDDNKGHNVFSDNSDDYLSEAPGTSNNCDSCAGSCHCNLDQPFLDGQKGLTGRQGCVGCHMVDDDSGPTGYHHADDSSPVIDAFPWYRFLGVKTKHATADYGVSGMEDPNWQYSPTSIDHNEYLGKYETEPPPQGNDNSFWSLDNKTMTSFCCGCHGVFHIQEPDGIWVRHPSDAVIPNSGEYAAYLSYNPEAPVARPDLTEWTGPSNTVTPTEDMVMCLSCHRPHGSPYPDMLRWDYTDMIAGGGGGTGGCFVCHTTKDQVL